MDTVQVTSDLRLPSLIRTQLLQDAQHFHTQHQMRFGQSNIRVHLKQDGPQVAVHLQFLTDGGRFFATSTGWDVRSLMQDALDNLELQVVKRVDRRGAAA